MINNIKKLADKVDKKIIIAISLAVTLVIAIVFLFSFSGENHEEVPAATVDLEEQAIDGSDVQVSLDLDKIKPGSYEVIDNKSIETENDDKILKEDKDYAIAPLPEDKDLKVLRDPAVGVVFLNFGLNQESARKALEADLINHNSCLAINPYANIERLNIAKYDKVVSIPFEPFSYPQSDPGEGVILTGMDIREIEERLDRFFSNVKGISGFTPIMGEKFFYSEKDTQRLFGLIKKFRIVFINQSPNVKSIANKVADKFSILNINIDYNIPKRAIFRSVESVLADAEDMARKTGFVIVAVDANNLDHLQRLNKWLVKVRKDGFRTISPIKLCLLQKHKMIDGPYIKKNFYKRAK